MALRRNSALIPAFISLVLVMSSFAMIPVFAASSSTATGNPSASSGPLAPVVNKNVQWAGYGIFSPTGAGAIIAIEGSFKQTKITCNPALNSPQKVEFLAALDGIAGDAPLDFEYVGTSAACATGAGTPSYAEVSTVPMAPVLTIKPGHIYSAEVAYSAGVFHYTLKDINTSKTSTGSGTQANAVFNAAECIVAGHFKLSTGALEPLAKFKTVSFGQDYTKVADTCDATVSDGSPTAIGAFGPPFVVYKYVMYNSAMTIVDAVPSALTADKSSFKVMWKAAGP